MKAMGFVHADVTVRGPGGERTLRMLVDTGSSFTWVPEGIARELGAREIQTVLIRLADNRYVTRALGELQVEILGKKATRLIVFALEGEEPLVGVDTLQGLMLEVDSATETLRPVPAALAM